MCISEPIQRSVQLLQIPWAYTPWLLRTSSMHNWLTSFSKILQRKRLTEKQLADGRLWLLTWQQRILLLRVHWDKQYIFEIPGHDNTRFAEDVEESHVQKKERKRETEERGLEDTHTQKKVITTKCQLWVGKRLQRARSLFLPLKDNAKKELLRTREEITGLWPFSPQILIL